jgi:RNA polymerase sigma factor (sigma-70 family)
MTENDSMIRATFLRERGRLGRFIRQRVRDPGEAEDILQDVFLEFLQVDRLAGSIEQVGAWLFRVARNRIIDRFRKKKERLGDDLAPDAAGADWVDTLLAPDADGPETAYARKVLLEALFDALDTLPREQREVFIANEIEGRSFKALARESGVSINTLLARKRYALQQLRRQLQALRDECYP